MFNRLFALLLLLAPFVLAAQESSWNDNLSFTGDFRFRVEHDWNSHKSDGTLRQDRSRLRYRLRLGFHYKVSAHTGFGARIRTGRLDDQQGPHTTLGGNSGEFSTIQLGFEKIYFEWNRDWFKGWIGKQTFPFHKLNEVFWNDNVFPEGVAAQFQLPDASDFMTDIQVRVGHFVVNSQGAGFEEDRYVQGIQLFGKTFKDKLTLFPGFYYFNQMSNIPDGQGSYNIDYSILHLGAEYVILNKPRLSIGVEYYENLQDLSQNDSISGDMTGERRGEVITLRLGRLKEKGQWQATLYLAHIEQYSIVDYFAQNDWARWDYSSSGAAGSRLSNFQGFEFRLGYAFSSKSNLILRAYSVEQLVSETGYREDGDRIRIDYNVKF